ncbi:MAG: DUF1015 domain-containing protein [Clostridiales bacterium]|nr:DUF1015 domain-containing protein [Candidatus Equinaster intestinalis]
MAEIKGFRALRFTDKAGDKKQVCCPPYDIISEEEKQAFLRENEHNIIRLELPEQTPEGYKSAADTLGVWEAEGYLAQDKKESIYIYEEKFEVAGVNYAFRGFTCYAKLHEFSENIILPHEETLSKAKTDRLNLLKASGCSFSQIYSLYSDKTGETARLISELSSGAPDDTFTDNAGVTHSLWAVENNEKTAEIYRQFENRKLYIADGHHRYETALNYRKYCRENGKNEENSEYIMMFLIDMENDGLVVFPTHRIVRELESFNREDVLKKSEKYFDVKKIAPENAQSELDAAYNKGEKAFVMLCRENADLLTLKDITVMDKLFPEKSEALRRLDVSVLHSLILEEIMGIDKENMAKQINLTYTRSDTEAYQAAKTYADCSFLINPTRVEEIALVAAAGEKMPQKSTYFYPKLITGLVMNKVR